ncbi:inositol monophosphatase family protein [Caballeronia sordidicola]|jgi:inositol-phosphate phosphatase/L-galactose 1-phosphate phosphatase/histidinol-phosphatase|uniref:Histidinol-phosphatase n=1 Tax=Caballeronia sordidicola TaxID=196367 RepID=A0A226WR82_CABSO|nr:inositol monophosphatase family protein [Caballeronia sordidicola]OXC73307.1 Histidinol-phosphatase [Caballeronia sordidicola]
MNLFEDYRQFASSTLDETGPIGMRYFRQPIDIAQKADASPVTVADIEIEAMIRDRIARTYPSHGILGEEQGSVNLSAELCWVIDPIDGTKSFISGIPLWGTLLALLKDAQPVFGIIDVPALDERYVATLGRQTERNGDVIRTSHCDDLRKCNLFATSPDMFSITEFQVFDSLSRQARFRRYGGDCYNYAMLAAGNIDAVVEAGLKPYDYLPVVPIVNGAGGLMTDWNGNPLTPSSDGRVIAAATPALHRALLEETAKFARTDI